MPCSRLRPESGKTSSVASVAAVSAAQDQETGAAQALLRHRPVQQRHAIHAAPGVRKIAGSAITPVNASTASQTRVASSRIGMCDTAPATMPIARMATKHPDAMHRHGGHDQRADAGQFHARIQTLQEAAGDGHVLGEEGLLPVASSKPRAVFSTKLLPAPACRPRGRRSQAPTELNSRLPAHDQPDPRPWRKPDIRTMRCG